MVVQVSSDGESCTIHEAEWLVRGVMDILLVLIRLVDLLIVKMIGLLLYSNKWNISSTSLFTRRMSLLSLILTNKRYGTYIIL